MVGQRLKEVAQDFYLVSGLVVPSHTGMVAEDAGCVDGRVSDGYLTREIGGVVLEVLPPDYGKE